MRAFVIGFAIGGVIAVFIVILVVLGSLSFDTHLICQHMALKGCK